MSVVYRRDTTDHQYNKSQVSVLAFKILSRQRELILVAFIVVVGGSVKNRREDGEAAAE